MDDQPLGTTTMTQVGIIVQDVEAHSRRWARCALQTQLATRIATGSFSVY